MKNYFLRLGIPLIIFVICSCSSNSVEQKAKLFTEKFYGSLETSRELIQEHYGGVGVVFNTRVFEDCIDNASEYSEKRVSNLTEEYHDRFNIALIEINSINVTGNVIELNTIVEYQIFELGTFYNEEKLTINTNEGNPIINTWQPTLMKWEDIRLNKTELLDYEGLENFSETDFYETIGSLNKN